MPKQQHGRTPKREPGAATARAKEQAAAERRAWTTYSEATRDLSGEDYDETEAASWARLQRDLAEIPGRVPDAEEPSPSARP